MKVTYLSLCKETAACFQMKSVKELVEEAKRVVASSDTSRKASTRRGERKAVGKAAVPSKAGSTRGAGAQKVAKGGEHNIYILYVGSKVSINMYACCDLIK